MRFDEFMVPDVAWFWGTLVVTLVLVVGMVGVAKWNDWYYSKDRQFNRDRRSMKQWQKQKR